MGSTSTTRPSTDLLALGVGAVAAVLAAWAPQIFNDGDTFMHVAAGLRMLRDHAVLTTDPFSFTFGGRPWQTHEWLSEVVLALGYRLAGFSGVALLAAGAFGLTAALLVRHAGRWLSGPALIAMVVVGLASLSSSLLARPHLLALPCLEMWAAELVIARGQAQMPDWRRLAPLMIVWANLHGSFFFGLALLGAFGLEAVIQARWARGALLRWAGLGAVCAAAAAVGPHGLNTLIFPLKLLTMKVLPEVGEWRAMTPATQPAFEAALLAGVFVLIRVRAKLSLLSLALLMLLVWLALGQVRQVLLFGVIAPLLIAQPLGIALAASSPTQATGEVAPRTRRGVLLSGLALLACVLVVAVPRLAVPVELGNRTSAPQAALAHVPASLRGQPVLNAYPFGGYLMLQGDRPYIDSRAEVYGDAFLADYARLNAGDPQAVAAALADPRIRWTLLEPGTPLAQAMDHAPGWKRLYADPVAVAHVRTN
jgi:hypothetical protein